MLLGVPALPQPHISWDQERAGYKHIQVVECGRGQKYKLRTGEVIESTTEEFTYKDS